jgi:hypothetical protein
MNELRHEYMCVWAFVKPRKCGRCRCERDTPLTTTRSIATTFAADECMSEWMKKKKGTTRTLCVSYNISVCCIVIIIMSSNILLLSTYFHEKLTLLLDIILRVTTLWRSVFIVFQQGALSQSYRRTLCHRRMSQAATHNVLTWIYFFHWQRSAKRWCCAGLWYLPDVMNEHEITTHPMCLVKIPGS